MDDIYERTNSFWVHRELKTYGIERKERRICFGNPGYIDEWVFVGSFDTEEERDAELKRLQEYTDLSVTEKDGYFCGGYLGIEYRAVYNSPMIVLYK